MAEDDPASEAAAVEIPLTDALDLHAFHPRDVGALVPHYLDECWARGFVQVRIIHGKGTGTLARRVHALLDRHPAVAGYQLADESGGGWGATVVRIKPMGGL